MNGLRMKLVQFWQIRTSIKAEICVFIASLYFSGTFSSENWINDQLFTADNLIFSVILWFYLIGRLLITLKIDNFVFECFVLVVVCFTLLCLCFTGPLLHHFWWPFLLILKIAALNEDLLSRPICEFAVKICLRTRNGNSNSHSEN